MLSFHIIALFGVGGQQKFTTMKKFLLILAVVAMLLPSCKKIEESINALENRIEVLENETIPTIDEQIAAIQTSIKALKEVDESLDESIKALEANDEATAEEIAALQDADAAIEAKIEELKKYVDDAINSTKDWVSATFATLEQLNALSSEVAALKSLVDANKAEAAANLANAIANLETSLKKWVGEQLSNYYTIAEIDAKIAELQKAITDGDKALQQQLNDLKTQLESAKKELTEAYKKAIEEAITENNGVINTKIANEIAAVNKRIDEEVAAINAKIAALQVQVDKNSSDIAKLLARIQSVSYVPQYSDGKAQVTRIGAVSEVILDFKVSPKECVAELEKVWSEALSCEAVYTKTRAVSLVKMPVTEFVADAENGIITVTASGENLSEEFFAGTQEASIALTISDGNNSVTSEYVPITIKNEIKNEKISFTSLQRIDDDIKVFSVANQDEGLSQYTVHLDGAKFIYNPISTSWIGESDHSWPANGCSYILATCPYSLNTTITTKMAKNGLIEELSLLGIENNTLVQQDILYSDLLYVELPQNITPTLNFNHALTQINISFKKTDSACKVILKSVKLCNVGTAGDLRIYPNIQGKSTASWTINKILDSSFCKNGATNLDVTLTHDTTCVLEPKLILPSNQTAIMFVYTVDGHELTYTHSLSGNWEMGYKYTYNYTINVNEIIFDRTIEDWGFTDDTITI